jgi:hypothetical protein
MEVSDKNGRKYTLRELDPGDHLDLAEIAGEQSTNRGYMQRAAITFMVLSIDGVPLPISTDRKTLRANAKQIGNEGMSAILAELFPDPSAAADRKQTDTVAVAKN